MSKRSGVRVMALESSDWHREDVDVVFRNPQSHSLRTPAMARRYAIRRQVYVTVWMRSGLTRREAEEQYDAGLRR